MYRNVCFKHKYINSILYFIKKYIIKFMKYGIQKKGNERESIGNNDMATKEIMVTQHFLDLK